MMPTEHFTQKLAALKTDEIGVTFSPEVRDIFRKLHTVMKDRPHFDEETLGLIEDMTSPKPHSLPVAFAAVAMISSEIGQHAQESNNLIAKQLLQDLNRKLFSLDRSPQSVQLVTAARGRVAGS